MTTATREEFEDPRLRIKTSAALLCTAVAAVIVGALAYSHPLLAVVGIIGVGLVA